MATLDERIGALYAAINPPPATGSQTMDDRIGALELAAVGMTKSPDPRTLDTRIGDLEAFVASS